MMEKFTYITESGEKLVLPRFENIPFGVIRGLRKLSEAEQFFGLLEKVLAESDLEILDKMTQGQVYKLMDAWQANSGVDLGESSGSSN